MITLLVVALLAAERSFSAAPAWPKRGDTVYADVMFFTQDTYSGERGPHLWPCAPLIVTRIRAVPQPPSRDPKTGAVSRRPRIWTWYFKDAGGLKWTLNASSLHRMYRTEAECKAPHEYPQLGKMP